MIASSFRLDTYNASGAQLNGKTIEVSNVTLTTLASRIGSLSFTVPAEIAEAEGFTYGIRYRLYHETLGYLGEFKHDADECDADGRTTTITALDQLVRLNDNNVGFNWVVNDSVLYGFGGIVTILCTMVGLVVQFANTSSEYDTFTRDFQGESIFTAMDTVRQSQRGYFTMSAPGIVRFGRFTAALLAGDVAAYLSNAGLSAGAGDESSIIAITKLRRTGTSANVVNRIIPRGAGLGQTQLDLRYSDRTTPYTIQSRGNRDGANANGADPANADTRMYFVEDAASVATYGAAERVLPFSDLRPVTNSIADRKNASNALYDIGVAYMQQFSTPTINYEVECANPPAEVIPGSVVMIDFRGVVETEDGRRVFLRLNQQRFFVIGVTRRFVQGSVIASLTISESGERVSEAIDVFVNVLQDVDKIKVKVQPYMSLYSRCGGTDLVQTGLSYNLYFELGDEILELNSMKCRFNLAPMRSTLGFLTGNQTTVGQVTGDGGALTAAAIVNATTGTGTAASGGGGTVSTTTAGTSHAHAWYVVNGTAGNTMFFDNSTNVVRSAGGAGGAGSSITTTPEASHTHNWTSVAHTHTLTMDSHVHTVTVAAHTHPYTAAAHAHPLAFSINTDSTSPTTVRCYLDGVEYGTVYNLTLAAPAGYPLTGPGRFEIDLLGLLIAAGDWHGEHSFTLTPSGGRGTAFGEMLGRVTIQPIVIG